MDKARTPGTGEKAAGYKFDSDKIFNAFLLPGNPGDGEPLKYIGYAEAHWNTESRESYRRVHGILLDTKTLMENHGWRDSEAIKMLARVILKAAKS